MGKTREVRTFLLAPASASTVGSVRLRFMDGCLTCEMAAGGGFCSVCICERSASALLAKKSAAACCSGKCVSADD